MRFWRMLIASLGMEAFNYVTMIINQSNELEESATCSILELVHFDKHNAQYAPIEVEQFDRSHDRFLCIDNTVYHIGASLKDLGKKWFAFNRMEQTTDDLLSKM
jgi:hypothetical protein